MDISKVNQWIAEDNTEQAIQYLLKETQGFSENLQNQLIVISSRYKAYEEAVRMGVADEAHWTERNKINAAILDIAQQVKKQNKPRSNLFRWQYWLLGTVSGLFILGGIVFKRFFSPLAPTPPPQTQSQQAPPSGLTSFSGWSLSLSSWEDQYPTDQTLCKVDIQALKLSHPNTHKQRIQLQILFQHKGADWQVAVFRSEYFSIELGKEQIIPYSEIKAELRTKESRMFEIEFDLPREAHLFQLLVQNANNQVVRVLFKKATAP